MANNRIANILKKAFPQTMSSIESQLMNRMTMSYNMNKKGNIDMVTFFSNWCFVFTEYRAKAVSNVDFYLTDLKDNAIEKHWINDLLKKPNPRMSWKSMKKTIQKWLDYNGNGFLVSSFFNPNQPPTLLYLMPPTNVTVKAITELPLTVGYSLYGKSDLLTEKEIIHFKTIGLTNDFAESLLLGQPVYLQAAADAILSDDGIIEFIKRFYKRDAVAPLVLSTPKDSKQLNKEEKTSFVADIRDKFPNFDVLGYLGGGAEIKPLINTNLRDAGLSPDAEASTIRRMGAIFGVTQGLVTGEFENRATADTHRETFITNTLEDMAQTFEETLTNYFQQFDSNIKFKHDPLSIKDFERKMKQRESMFDRGMLTRNEIRIEEGYEPIQDGDVALINGSYASVTNILNPVPKVNPVNVPVKSNKLYSDFGVYKDYPEITKYKIWKSIDDGVEEHYQNILKANVKSIKHIEKIVLKKLSTKKKDYFTKGGISENIELMNEEEMLKYWNENLSPEIKALILEVLKSSADLIDVDIEIDDYTKEIQRLGDETTDLIKESINTIDSDLKDTIKRIVKDNPDVSESELLDKILKETKRKFSEVYTESRARLISRTTTTYNTTGSQKTIFNDFGFKSVWVSSRDNKVRQHHKEADGKKADKEGNFHVGSGTGQHPGAIDVAEENYNCRCYIFPQK